MVTNRLLLVAAVIATLSATGCGSPSVPSVDGLRESFAQQLAANRFVEEFQRNADDLFFTGPGAEGGTARWRVHFDSAVVEPNSDPAKPYKGVVKSSWYWNDKIVRPAAGESNLPLQLTSTGLAQDCWAFWDKAAGKWTWE